jgi:site-specific DNA recombinase
VRAAIYCRVSTDDQEKEGTSLQTQLEACLKYCQEKGYQVNRRFSETYSGLTLDRPKLIELREMINANQVDVIVVYCLDRLSRDPAHGAMLFQQLEEHNVRLEAVTETIENTDLGKLISYIRGFASKLEADKIRERTMRGKLARVKEGKLPQGTGIGIYGYNWDKATGKRTINESEADVVRKIFTMASGGTSFNRIAIKLNQEECRTKSGSLWHPLTIRRIVTNPTYTGKTYYGMSKRVGKTKVITQPRESWTLLTDITPPIIPEEMFNRTQEAVKQARLSRPVNPHAAYLLTGFIRCPKCGSSISGTTLNGKYRYYKCRGSIPTATRGKICDTRYIKAGILEDSVWDKIRDMLSDPLTLLRTLNNENHRQPDRYIEQLTKQINDLRKKLKAYPLKERNLYDLLAHEAVTKEYVLEAIDNLKKERLDNERQLQSLLSSRKEATRSDRLELRLSQASALEFMKFVYNYDPQNLLYPPSEPSKEDQLAKKRGLLASIKLKVLADPKGYEFSFTLDGTIISTTDANESFADELEEFEEQHPDISVRDLLDTKELLPGDTPFVQKVNQLKRNLVTIERTSA